MKKYKVTGFTRFILFMIFIIPAIYLGVGYAKGEDPIKQIKDTVGLSTNTEGKENSSRRQPSVRELQSEINRLEKALSECEKGK